MKIQSIENQGIKEDFSDFCLAFLKNILRYLLDYLPVEDEIIATFDFVLFFPKIDEMKKKILKFNRVFKILFENEAMIVEEITKLYRLNIDWERITSKAFLSDCGI